MKSLFQRITICLAAIILFASTVESHAFALLGPVAPWMQATNGVIQSGDIGGPMDIGSGYRWNVPVVTYGFDKSFLDYFGTNGVAHDTGLRKFGALLGDGAEVGCNAVLNPGSILERGAVIYPNVFWRGILPANMIAKNKAEIEVVVKRPRETK